MKTMMSKRRNLRNPQWHNGTMAQRSMSSILDIFGHRCHRFMLQARPLAMSQGEARTVSIVTRLDEKCHQTRPERLVFSKRFMAISPPYEATNQIQPMSTSIQPAGGFNMFQLQLFFSVHIFSSTVNDAEVTRFSQNGSSTTILNGADPLLGSS